MSEHQRLLIDRQELLRFFTISPSGERYRVRNIDNFPIEVQLEAVQKKIREAPIIDAVEVVRCKDCVFASKDAIHRISLKCEKFSPGPYTHRVQPLDFCSYGERNNANVD